MMPKMLCKCDSMLYYGDIPCKIEYKFISDTAYNTYEGNIDSEKLYLEMKSFLNVMIVVDYGYFGVDLMKIR